MFGPIVVFTGTASSSQANGTEQLWYGDPALAPLGKGTKKIQVSLNMSGFTTNGGGAAIFALYLEHSNDGRRWTAVETLIPYASGTAANYQGLYKTVASSLDYAHFIRLVLGVKDSAATTVQGVTPQMEVTGKPF